jgi:hypothetical protein
MVSIEEAADHHVGLTRAAVVRPPVQASQFLVWKHGCHVGLFARHCEDCSTR